MNQSTNPWTDEEIKILRENYPTIGYKVQSLIPNHSLSSIVSKASRLKVRIKHKIDLIDFNKVIEHINQGLKVRELCKLMNIDQSTLHKYCVKHGLSLRAIYKDNFLSKRSNTGKKTYFLNQLRKYKITNSFNTCCVCGFQRCIDLAHVIPARDNGPFSIENIVPLCPNCHRLFDSNNLYQEELNMMRVFNQKMKFIVEKK